MVVRQSVCGGPSPSRKLGSRLQALPWTSKGQRTERRSFLWLRYHFHSAAWSTFNHMRECVKRYECGMKDHALGSDNLLYHMHAGQNKNAHAVKKVWRKDIRLVSPGSSHCDTVTNRANGWLHGRFLWPIVVLLLGLGEVEIYSVSSMLTNDNMVCLGDNGSALVGAG